MQEHRMKEVKLLLTDAQYNALAQLSYDAEQVYKEDIPLSAVVMTAAMKGMAAIRYELAAVKKNEFSKIRLVK